jgi:hypothetical protein
MKLKAIQDSFLFEFASETAGGRFIEKNKLGLILTNQALDEQAKYARWGKVLAIGPRVSGFDVGDYVLIEYGKWTTAMNFEDKKYWKSAQDFVLALGDEAATYAY